MAAHNISIKLSSIQFRLFRSLRWRGVLFLLSQESGCFSCGWRKCRVDDSWDLWQKENFYKERKRRNLLLSKQSQTTSSTTRQDIPILGVKKIEKYKLKQTFLLFTQSILWSFRILYSYCNDDSPGVYFQCLNFSFFYFIHSILWFWKHISLKFIFPNEKFWFPLTVTHVNYYFEKKKVYVFPTKITVRKEINFVDSDDIKTTANLWHLPWSFPMLSQTMIKKEDISHERSGKINRLIQQPQKHFKYPVSVNVLIITHWCFSSSESH